jgi:UDP-3-O-[3-hydroxymyristoyl] glucosamine N-acyltransferase
MAEYTAEDLARELGGRLEGEGSVTITGVSPLASAEAGQLTFIGEAKYAKHWPASHASAALVADSIDLTPGAGRALIRVAHPDLAMGQALELFAQPVPTPPAGVHPSAVVDPSARIEADAAIGPFCHIGAEAQIGSGAVLHGSVTVGYRSEIGAHSELWPGVVVRERCQLGQRCIAHPNVVIGSDGFGYRPAQGEAGPYMAKMPHIGTVAIGDDVELGSGTCIDRGKFAATTLGQGCKIDNLVQIGHNCQLGKHVTIAAASAIGGSVTIGDWALLGGGVIVRDHMTLASGVQLAGGAGVGEDLPEPGRYAGRPARPYRQAMREWKALKHLPDLVKRRGRR